jgi:hypothetical protein
VIDAWQEFLGLYPGHWEMNMANWETILWAGRIVMHHLNPPSPLNKVGELLRLVVKDVIAANTDGAV